MAYFSADSIEFGFRFSTAPERLSGSPRIKDSNAQSLRGASNRFALSYLSSSAAYAPDFNDVRRSQNSLTFSLQVILMFEISCWYHMYVWCGVNRFLRWSIKSFMEKNFFHVCYL